MKGMLAMRKEIRVPEASAGRRCRLHKSSKKFWATCFTLSSPLRFRFASSISSPPTCYWFGLCSWLCSSSIWFLWGVLLLNVDARWWCMYESLSIPWCHKVTSYIPTGSDRISFTLHGCIFLNFDLFRSFAVYLLGKPRIWFDDCAFLISWTFSLFLFCERGSTPMVGPIRD